MRHKHDKHQSGVPTMTRDEMIRLGEIAKGAKQRAAERYFGSDFLKTPEKVRQYGHWSKGWDAAAAICSQVYELNDGRVGGCSDNGTESTTIKTNLNRCDPWTDVEGIATKALNGEED